MIRDGLYWREPVLSGGQIVAGPFDCPREAGRWRRDHPPLQKRGGPVLIRVEGGMHVSPSAEDLSRCFTTFLPAELATERRAA